jgi:putative oxidoreductase
MEIAIGQTGARLASAAALPVRAAMGATMAYHGVHKLRGKGLEQSGAFFDQVGLQPGKPLALATGVAEAFAGGAVALGLLVRPAALAVLVTQSVAIWKVHGSKGFDITRGGFEFNLSLMAIALALLVAGPGRFSAHEALEHLAEGRGPRRLLNRVRPSPLVRFLKLVK